MLLLVCCTSQHLILPTAAKKNYFVWADVSFFVCFFFFLKKRFVFHHNEPELLFCAEIESRLRQRVSVPCKGTSSDILAKTLGFICKHQIFPHYASRRLICAAKLFLTLFWCPDENNRLTIAALRLDALVINHIIILFWWAKQTGVCLLILQNDVKLFLRLWGK